jgi:hypothetical protein
MKPTLFLLLLASVLLAPIAAFAQGGNSAPQTTAASTGQVVTSLAVPGYEFDLLEGSLGLIQLFIDPQGPIAIPLVAVTPGVQTGLTLPVPIIPGFSATFTLANHSAINREFNFAWQYWATNDILFKIYDSNGNQLWQSVQVPVDKPPLAAPVTLTLAPGKSWTSTTFIPLALNGAYLPDGNYVLEASLTGSPVYSASAPFSVKNLVGGPIIVPFPGTGLEGIAQVSPVTALPVPGQANTKPLPGATIKVQQIHKVGVISANPLFSSQATADAQGKFSLLVPPGDYTVTGVPPIPGAPWPAGSTQTVHVTSGTMTTVVVNFDSGVR